MIVQIEKEELSKANWEIIFELFDFKVDLIGEFTAALTKSIDNRNLDLDSLLQTVANRCKDGISVNLTGEEITIQYD